MSKCPMSAVKQKAVSILAPLQLGVGDRGGCEAMAHTVQGLLNRQDDELVVAQVDFLNTFNLADRALAFKEVQEHFPELSHLVANCYGVAAKLMFGETVIPSTRGFFCYLFLSKFRRKCLRLP